MNLLNLSLIALLSGGISIDTNANGVLGLEYDARFHYVTYISFNSNCDGVVQLEDKLISIDGSTDLDHPPIGYPGDDCEIIVKRDGKLLTFHIKRIELEKLYDANFIGDYVNTH